MKSYNQQNLKDFLETLDKNVRDYIFSKHATNKTLSIYENINIPENQKAHLGSVIGFYLAGKIPDNDLSTVISEELSVDKNTGEKYAQAIIKEFESDREKTPIETPPEPKEYRPSLADELLHVAGVKQQTTHIKPAEKTDTTQTETLIQSHRYHAPVVDSKEKPLDAELMGHLQKTSTPHAQTPTQNTDRVENIGASKPIVNPFSDQTPVHEPEEKVTPDTQLPPIVKPVPIPPKAVTPPFETQAQAEKTEPLHVEQEYSPAIDSANKKSDEDYRGNDPYREPIN